MSRLSGRTAALLTVPPLLWAGNALAGRLFVGHVPPLTLNALRWWLALALLLPIGRRVLRHPAVLRAQWRHWLLVGTLGLGSYNALQYLALVSSTPINVTLIASSMPVWMLAVGALCFGVRPRRSELAGAVLSLTGVAIVVARGDPAVLAQVRWAAGDGYVLVAAIAWAFYSWLLARPPVRTVTDGAGSLDGAGPAGGWSWSETLLVQVVFGLLAASAAAGAEQALGAAPIRWSPAVAAGLLFVAIGPSLIAYRCWGAGVAAAGPAVAAFFSNLTPLFTALLSAAVLGEPPRAFHALAFACIVAGIGVSSAGGSAGASAGRSAGGSASRSPRR